MEVMSLKHTPGPWEERIFHQEVFGPDGIRIANCASRIRSDEEADANTHLIAAAPDLLEALEGLQPFIDEDINMMSLSQAYEDALNARTAAINKAKGLQP